jgi:hypothetical protein
MSNQDQGDERSFLAHARGSRHRAHRVEAASPLLAALAYAEQTGEVDEEGRVAVTVEACASGERHCFVVDLDDGPVSGC